MKWSPTLIQKVQALRAQGYTYREITTLTKCQIPKGTLSGWLKDIPLPDSYYLHIKESGHDNITKALIHNKKLLSARLTALRNKNKFLLHHIDKSVGKLILATLYWCEGNKYPSSRYLKFGNSDSGMISLFITLLRECYKLDESKFRLTVQCRADQNQDELTKYWTKVTNIPPSQHYPARIDTRSVGKPTQKVNYHGVCVVDYFCTDLQCELQFTGELLGSADTIELMKKLHK